jgi:hypothetical protein
VPREATSGARVTSRLIQRGRVALEFADSSRLVLMTGFLFTGAARRLVTALRRTCVSAGRAVGLPAAAARSWHDSVTADRPRLRDPGSVLVVRMVRSCAR